jgi:hypothetical protein
VQAIDGYPLCHRLMFSQTFFQTFKLSEKLERNKSRASTLKAFRRKRRRLQRNTGAAYGKCI